MSEQTKIQWADSTVNFWSGCTKVSAGCANCYAEGLSKRGLPNVGGWGKGAPRRKSKSAVKDALAFNRKPLICDNCGEAIPLIGDHYKKCPEFTTHRRRIFSLSLGDWLDDEVPIEWLAEMLDTIRRCDQVTWILCSKRWENWRGQLVKVQNYAAENGNWQLSTWCAVWLNGGSPQGVIGLCSVENQEAADSRIPQFLTVPLACRGLSLEPLLGAVNLRHRLGFKNADGVNIHWLIIGGESGHNARPCNLDWIRSLVQQGKAAGVATFVKQLGAFPIQAYATRPVEQLWPAWTRFKTNAACSPGVSMIDLRDKKGGDPAEWSADLRVQEFPTLANGGTS